MMRRTLMTAAYLASLAGPAAAMSLTSSDIAPGAAIAAAQIYPRCGGQNISPQLSWSGAPAGTKSFVVTMIDTDVQPAYWSHWIVVDLPPDTTGLARGTDRLPAGAKQVATNFGDAAYGGPCPPQGTGVHHYQITIWAMPAANTAIEDDAKATEVSAMLQKSALGEASLTGWVKR